MLGCVVVGGLGGQGEGHANGGCHVHELFNLS